MKKGIFLILMMLFCLKAFSQTKEIKGDTIYWYKTNIELQKDLGLQQFEKSDDEFNFRFRNHGQVVEISKDGSEINGSIVNYIYHNKRSYKKESELLSNKIILTPQQSKNVFKIVHNSKILKLPSDNNIENWSHGKDGITYIIEHSDKKNYWHKTYWTPSSQDSIPEAIIVLDIVNKLSDTLGLAEAYKSFEQTLPKKGCYSSGGALSRCYVSNSLDIGYSGATKLPLGFYSSYSATYIGKAKINGNVFIQYNFDNRGFYHFNSRIAKWSIFCRNYEISDYLLYTYQNRFLNTKSKANKFENHQFIYGLNLKKNIGLGVGLDYLSRNYHTMGSHFYTSKRFSKINIHTKFSTSLFNNWVNYKAEISKGINFNSRYRVNRISVGLTYEDFMDYKDLYFSVRILVLGM